MGCQEYTLHRGSVSGQCSGGDHHIQAGFQGDRIKLKYKLQYLIITQRWSNFSWDKRNSLISYSDQCQRLESRVTRLVM